MIKSYGHLCRKGFYPYEWIDGFEKLDYEGIPPKDAFSSQLKSKNVLYDDNDGEYKLVGVSCLLNDCC